jgi:hypothetical protein
VVPRQVTLLMFTADVAWRGTSQQLTSGGASPGVMPTGVVVVDDGARSMGVD